MIAETLPVAMQKNSCGERLLIGLIAFCVFNLLTFFIQVLPFYYFTCIFSCGYLLLVCRQQKYTGRYFIFLLFCALSLLVHPPAPIFDAWERLILFCLVLVIASPCIYSTTLNFFRFKLQQILYCILNIIVLSSLVLYLSGAGKYQGSYYAGITIHSMLLAPCSAIIIFYSWYHSILFNQQKKPRRQLIVHGLSLISALCMLLLTGSRSGLGATLGGMGIFFLLLLSFERFVKYILWMAVLICCISFFGESKLFQPLLEKNGGSLEFQYDSRIELWEMKWAEFKTRPLCGIGFATAAESLEGNLISNTGRIESGSSWLGLLATTGVLGMAAFVNILVYSIGQLRRIYRQDKYAGSFLSAVLVFWLLHMLAEGYLWAGGSVLCLLFWLWLGVINSVEKMPELSKKL